VCGRPSLAEHRWRHLTTCHKRVLFPPHSIWCVFTRNGSVQVLSLSHLAFSSPLEGEAAWGCGQQAQPVTSFGALAGKKQGRAPQGSWVDGEVRWHEGEAEVPLKNPLPSSPSSNQRSVCTWLYSPVQRQKECAQDRRAGCIKVYGASSDTHCQLNGVSSSAVQLWECLLERPKEVRCKTCV